MKWEEMMKDFKPQANSTFGKFLASSGVEMTADLKRIIALPRREEIPDYRLMLTKTFRRQEGTWELRQLQADALYEMWNYNGLFGAMPVGSGKSLVSLLAASLFKAKRPLLMVPANLLHKAQKLDYVELRKQFRLSKKQAFLSHETLGSEKSKDILFALMPDLLVVDEAHYFKNMKAARTKRLLRYIDTVRASGKFELRVVFLSGSMTRNSIRNYWHLLIRCLPSELCPLPMSWRVMDTWANALDANPNKTVAPGALLHLCDPTKEPLTDEPLKRARSAFRRRLVETPAIIATTDSGFGKGEEPGINIFEVFPKDAPDEIKKAFYDLRMFGTTPSDELVTDAMSIWRHATELSLGFYSRWVWPQGLPDIEWLEIRKNWHGVVREVLKNGARYNPPIDSNLGVYRAFEEGKLQDSSYNLWMQIRDRYADTGGTPPTEIVWISYWMFYEVQKVLKKIKKPTIVWVHRPSFGKTLAKALGVEYFGAGDEKISGHKKTCVASIKAHGTGKNLQQYANNLLLGGLHGSAAWQQWMGRTHRAGQKEDTVNYYLFLHSKELRNAFETAREESAYVQETVGEEQKILKATLEIRAEDELPKQKDPLWSVSGWK